MAITICHVRRNAGSNRAGLACLHSCKQHPIRRSYIGNILIVPVAADFCGPRRTDCRRPACLPYRLLAFGLPTGMMVKISRPPSDMWGALATGGHRFYLALGKYIDWWKVSLYYSTRFGQTGHRTFHKWRSTRLNTSSGGQQAAGEDQEEVSSCAEDAGRKWRKMSRKCTSNKPRGRILTCIWTRFPLLACSCAVGSILTHIIASQQPSALARAYHSCQNRHHLRHRNVQVYRLSYLLAIRKTHSIHVHPLSYFLGCQKYLKMFIFLACQRKHPPIRRLCSPCEAASHWQMRLGIEYVCLLRKERSPL